MILHFFNNISHHSHKKTYPPSFTKNLNSVYYYYNIQKMSALTFLIFIILSYFTYSIRLINKQLHFQSEFNNKSKIMQQINITITSLR